MNSTRYLIYLGDHILWNEQCRFRHLATGRYMRIDGEGSIGLTYEHSDPKTVFRLYPVIEVVTLCTS